MFESLKKKRVFINLFKKKQLEKETKNKMKE
jgi:hypothetical protein